MPDSDETERPDPGAKGPGGISALFASANRGLLLDLVVFAANLLLMQALAGPFLGLIRSAAEGDRTAGIVLFCFGLALFALPPVGASLKRWHYHRRRGSAAEREPFDGCLFNPIFYFCLMAVIFAALNAAVLQTIYGRTEPPGGVFVSTILGGIVLILAHTVLVYRFFSRPKSEPRSAFLRGRSSEVVGDACLFANMLFYQLVWNAMSFSGLGPPGDLGELIGRVLLLCFLALLLYFPPRMFYLAEDAGKWRTWAMILLANAPLIWRMVLGGGSGAGW